MLKKILTRREFLKVTGTGVAGGALLGASGLSSGCDLTERKRNNRPGGEAGTKIGRAHV